MIREAARQRIDALLIDPVDDPEVTAAANDARAKGKVVVLLDRNLPDRDSTAPLARVTFVPLVEPGRRLAEALLSDIRKAGLPADGHALIVVAADAGREARESAEGISAALKSAGFTDVGAVTIQDDAEKSSRLLFDRLAADPKLTALVGVGSTEMSANLNAR